MSTSGGESYTHLLVPVLKSYRPPMSAIVQLMDELIQTDVIGEKHELGFAEGREGRTARKRAAEPVHRQNPEDEDPFAEDAAVEADWGG
jgi:hypothetical protein